jgi:hypothetical protein
MGIADVMPTVAPTTRNVVLRVSRRRWERSYVAAVMAIDAAAALLAAATAYVVRFGGDPGPDYRLHYIALSASLPVLWLVAMSVARAYEPRFLTVGYEEFQRCAHCFCRPSLRQWARSRGRRRQQIARGYVIIALPLAALLTLLGRYLRERSCTAGGAAVTS